MIVYFCLTVRNEGTFSKYVDWNHGLICRDKDVMSLAVYANGDILRYCSEKFLQDPDLVRNAVQNYGLSLEHAPEDMKNDPEIVAFAVSDCAESIRHATINLRKDPLFILRLMRMNPSVCMYVDGDLLTFMISQDLFNGHRRN